LSNSSSGLGNGLHFGLLGSLNSHSGNIDEDIVSELLESRLEGHQLFGVEVSLSFDLGAVLNLDGHFLQLNEHGFVVLGESLNLVGELALLIVAVGDLAGQILSGILELLETGKLLVQLGD